MKFISAIIEPWKLNAGRQALSSLDAHGMTVTEVKSLGRQQGHTELYRATKYVAGFPA